MYRSKPILKSILEHVLPLLTLTLLLTYSYAKFFRHSFGIAWSSDGVISAVYVNEREPTLHEGDKLIQVGSVPFNAFAQDLRQDLFGGAKAGDVLPVVVERNGQTATVTWKVPGPNAGEMVDQFFSQWFLAYIFWLAGTATFLLVRPRDMRWFLLGMFNYLIAIWVLLGSGLSSYHIWYSALVLRLVIWMWLPVSLHLHWIFPKSLGKLPPWLRWSVDGLCVALGVAQWLQLVSRSLYYAAFLLAIIGSLGLLLAHARRQPEIRRDLRMLLIAAGVAGAPPVILGLLGLMHGTTPRVATLAMLSFPLLPFAYLYAAFRRQLGGLELRVNRVVSIYSYLILLGTVVVPVLLLAHQIPVSTTEQSLITSMIASITVTALSLWAYPRYQSYVEHRVLGIAVPSRELQQTYSAHITSSSSFTELTRLLDEEVMPSLLVRQFVFLGLDNGGSRILLRSGVSESQVPTQGAAVILAPLLGKALSRGSWNVRAYSWIRLVLALKVQDEPVGFWLFGRRDPDDAYSSAEIPILQLFANQTAIALSNILQSERLRAMYQADIDRHENERLSLARELHDSVLSELAGMLMNTDIRALPKGFQEGYQVLTQRLREIVSDLRPPMLNYGLKPAIEELADNLMERSKDTINIEVELESSGDRYPVDKEQHLFRIAQEACENAVRHSHGKNITISGRLAPDCVEMSIQDDGSGFRLARDTLQLYDLLSHRHFGLAGMLERAEVIDAEIRIDSMPGSGTQIFVRWLPQAPATAPAQGEVDSST